VEALAGLLWPGTPREPAHPSPAASILFH
jgi:hypothetical protein